MKHLMDFFYAHRGHILYPPQDVRTSHDAIDFRMTEQEMEHLLTSGGWWQADCSEMVTEVCRMAGLRDPNGLHYRYAGYTGTMLAHLGAHEYTDPKLAGVGALVVFGPGTGQHVSMVYEVGADPLLQSHGRRGMDRMRLSVERTWHQPPVRLLPIAAL
jgi:hypothetical protein